MVLEFDWGTNMDIANLDVISKLDAIQLPLQAKKPVTLRFDPTLDSIIRYAIYYEGSSPDKNTPVQLTSAQDIDDPSTIARLKQLRILSMS